MPPFTHLSTVLVPFQSLFSAPTLNQVQGRLWRKVQRLIVGTLLARGRRTVTAALRHTGQGDTPSFSSTIRYSIALAGLLSKAAAVSCPCWYRPSRRLAPASPLSLNRVQGKLLTRPWSGAGAFTSTSAVRRHRKVCIQNYVRLHNPAARPQRAALAILYAVALPIPSCFAACPAVSPAWTRACVAETVSRSSAGRPGLLPRFLAAAIPSRVRSEMSRLSKWAIAPKTWNTSSPAAEVVSMRSSRLTRWTSCALRFSTVSSSSLRERPRRSRRVTQRLSPGRAWSISCVSPGRSNCLPEITSTKTRMAPACRRRSSWAATS